MAILPSRFTKGQLELEKIINEIGLETILEYEFGNYRIDIFLPEVHKGIEYDGIGHHKNRDRKRDKFLIENFNLPILRITDLKDPDLKEKLKKFIDS